MSRQPLLGSRFDSESPLTEQAWVAEGSSGHPLDRRAEENARALAEDHQVDLLLKAWKLHLRSRRLSERAPGSQRGRP